MTWCAPPMQSGVCGCEKGEREIFVWDSSRASSTHTYEARRCRPAARFRCTLKSARISNPSCELTHPSDFKHTCWRLGPQKWRDKGGLRRDALLWWHNRGVFINLLPSCGWVRDRTEIFLATTLTDNHGFLNKKFFSVCSSSTGWCRKQNDGRAAVSLWTSYIL